MAIERVFEQVGHALQQKADAILGKKKVHQHRGLTASEIHETIINDEQFHITEENIYGKDIISIDQFTPGAVAKVLEKTAWMEEMFTSGARDAYCNILKGKRIMVNFGEQSTRTFSSFISAVLELGGMVVDIPDAFKTSSFGKGESLSDTMKTYEAQKYAAIVMRHPDDDSALKVAQSIDIPVISGGNGKLEHVTQAFLDLYTFIKETKKKPEDSHIVFVGDMKHGRTVHSLLKLLAIMGNKKMTFVSPESIKLPEELVDFLHKRGVEVTETSELDHALDGDAYYITRIQKERFTNKSEYKKVKSAYRIDHEFMKKIREDAVIMHPLPRIDEIAKEVDEHPNAAYFRQVENGLYTRMAILDLTVGNSKSATL